MNVSDFGSLLIGGLFIAFVYCIVAFNRYQKAQAEKVAKDKALKEDDGESQDSVLSFSAKRDDFDPLVAGSAVAPQKVSKEKRVDGPRGATRVKPADVDYSIFDQPTYLRRGVQLTC